MSMNSDIKAKWVSALRSGEYEKIEGALARKNSDDKLCFCALGVLCDINAGITSRSWGKLDTAGINYDYLGETATLPKEVAEWAGLKTRDPVIYRNSNGSGGVQVSGTNDQGTPSKRIYSFDDIADLIEKNL